MINRVRSASGTAIAVAYSALLSAGAIGCARAVQAWPLQLPNDARVTVRLSGLRSIVFEDEVSRDSVAGVRELHGRVVSLRPDTLVIRVTHAPIAAAGDRIIGRRATIILDSATVVTRSEVDAWKVGYGVLASAVLIFYVIIVSGS